MVIGEQNLNQGIPQTSVKEKKIKGQTWEFQRIDFENDSLGIISGTFSDKTWYIIVKRWYYNIKLQTGHSKTSNGYWRRILNAMDASPDVIQRHKTSISTSTPFTDVCVKYHAYYIIHLSASS